MIRVLLIDDSMTARLTIKRVLEADGGFEIVGMCQDGTEALDAVARLKPQVVTMDLHMPRMNGVEATRRIMETHPVPIAIVSNSWQDSGREFLALQAGALAVVEKPTGPSHPDFERTSAELVQTLKQVAGVRVVRRWALNSSGTPSTSLGGAAPAAADTPPPYRGTATTASGAKSSNALGTPARPNAGSLSGLGQGAAAPLPMAPRAGGSPAPVRSPTVPRNPYRIVAIGASTGGPPALVRVLKDLPEDFPLPILVVQHMATGFLGTMLHWMRAEVRLPVSLAERGQTFENGHVYLAPENFHLGVDRTGAAQLSTAPPEHSVRPSVSYLFRSLAKVYGGSTVAILLTGMGKDGAEELSVLRHLGALTMAQDKESSVVHGMPGEAIRLDAARHILPPEGIAAQLIKELGHI